MPLENHSLVHEFPQWRERIHELKLSNAHFAKLFDAYDMLEHEVHRIESGAESASDERLADLKKQRLHVKDELAEILQAAK